MYREVEGTIISNIVSMISCKVEVLLGS